MRLSKRLRMPSKRLRGFDTKKVGPVDQGDYVGGNYVAALNFEASVTKFTSRKHQTDVAAFLDFGNLWSCRL